MTVGTLNDQCAKFGTCAIGWPPLL